MNSVQYPQIAEHKKEHADLLEQLFVLKNKLDVYKEMMNVWRTLSKNER